MAQRVTGPSRAGCPEAPSLPHPSTLPVTCPPHPVVYVFEQEGQRGGAAQDGLHGKQSLSRFKEPETRASHADGRSIGATRSHTEELVSFLLGSKSVQGTQGLHGLSEPDRSVRPVRDLSPSFSPPPSATADPCHRTINLAAPRGSA